MPEMQQTPPGLIVPDFSEAPENLGPGVYYARIVDQEIGTWPANEKRAAITFVKWTMETFNSSEPKNNGRKLFHRTGINGKGAGIFAAFYKAAMGTEYPKGQPFSPEMLLGKELEVTVVDGMKDGQLTGYTEVKAVKSLAKQH